MRTDREKGEAIRKGCTLTRRKMPEMLKCET